MNLTMAQRIGVFDNSPSVNFSDIINRCARGGFTHESRGCVCVSCTHMETPEQYATPLPQTPFTALVANGCIDNWKRHHQLLCSWWLPPPKRLRLRSLTHVIPEQYRHPDCQQ
jgi:hypothetical protein